MAETLRTSHCGCDASDLVADLLPVETARRIAVGLAAPISEYEKVQVRRAIGRVTSRNVDAPQAMPFFDNSAMDGFAVRRLELRGEGPYRLPILGTIAAGADLGSVGSEPGTYRILTGAPLPQGFDAVAIQERCGIEGENVVIGYRPDAGENIRRHGEDVAEGAVIVPAGTPLAARHIGLLAANGIAEVTVCRKIRVAIFSTGDELERGTDLTRASSVYDANGPMLEALCASPMTEVEDHGVISDDKVAMTAKLRALADRCDLVLSSGGVSTGARDFLREALIAAGGSVEAHRVALKPGKPIAFGRLGRALYTGLPGNPFAAYVGFYLFVAGQIARLAGINERRDPAGRAIWSSTVSCKSGRTQYLPARVTGYNGDLPIVELVGHGGSASLYPVAQADGLAAIPANRSVIEAGEVVAWAAFQNSTTSMGPL